MTSIRFQRGHVKLLLLSLLLPLFRHLSQRQTERDTESALNDIILFADLSIKRKENCEPRGGGRTMSDDGHVQPQSPTVGVTMKHGHGEVDFLGSLALKRTLHARRAHKSRTTLAHAVRSRIPTLHL